MSAVWWVLLAYVAGVVVSVRPLAMNEARKYGYYCDEDHCLVSQPCPTLPSPRPSRYEYVYRLHETCGPRDARSIGASAIYQSLLWPILLAVFSAFKTWEGLTGVVGRVPVASKVDARRVAELERELGIDDA